MEKNGFVFESSGIDDGFSAQIEEAVQNISRECALPLSRAKIQVFGFLSRDLAAGEQDQAVAALLLIGKDRKRYLAELFMTRWESYRVYNSQGEMIFNHSQI
jgi:hypothetical protein